MSQANDGELTRLITVQTGGSVEDPAPNQPQPAQAAETSFDLHLEGVAGNVLGGSGSPYTLTITAFDLTAGAGAPALNPSAAQLSNPQHFNTTNWKAFGSPTIEYVTDQTFTINVPAGVSKHSFIYHATLVSDDLQEVWHISSNPFVLV